METKFKGAFYEALLSVSHVPELNRVREEEERGLLVGAAVPLNTLKRKLEEITATLPGVVLLYIVYMYICLVCCLVHCASCIYMYNNIMRLPYIMCTSNIITALD